MKAPTMLNEAVAQYANLIPETGYTISNPTITKIGRLCFISTAVSFTSKTLNATYVATFPDGFKPSSAYPTPALTTSGGFAKGRCNLNANGIQTYTDGAATWINISGFYIAAS